MPQMRNVVMGRQAKDRRNQQIWQQSTFVNNHTTKKQIIINIYMYIQITNLPTVYVYIINVYHTIKPFKTHRTARFGIPKHQGIVRRRVESHGSMAWFLWENLHRTSFSDTIYIYSCFLSSNIQFLLPSKILFFVLNHHI